MGRISDDNNSSIGDYPWMETAECGQCSMKWYICTLCTALRVHTRGLSNLRAHYRLCHTEDWRPPKKKSRLHATLPRIDSVLGASNTTTTPQPSRTAGEVPPRTTPPPCPPTLPTVQSSPITEESLKFENDQSRKYFEQEFRDCGGGGKYLVAKSFYRGEQKAEDLEEDDVEICLQLTLLVQSLSVGQNKLLGNFLDLLFQKIDRIRDLNLKKKLYDSIRKAYPNCSCTTCIKHPKTTEEGYSIDIPSLPPIPTTYGKIRLVILEGSKPLIPMLAHPTIRTLGNHAYVLPSQCIRHFLANGNSPMLFNNTTARNVYMSPKDTPCGITIASKIGSLQNNSSAPKHLPISFVEWKDNCKSSKSNKVSKTGSIWV
jgi:hypothetical protein